MRVRFTDLPARLRFDMILWDGESGYEANVTAMGDRIDNKFTFAVQDVDRMREKFDAIRLMAEDWPEPA